MWDDEAGYDRDDPKHPDWADAMADKADMDRKRLKEQADEDEYRRGDDARQRAERELEDAQTKAYEGLSKLQRIRMYASGASSIIAFSRAVEAALRLLQGFSQGRLPPLSGHRTLAPEVGLADAQNIICQGEPDRWVGSMTLRDVRRALRG